MELFTKVNNCDCTMCLIRCWQQSYGNVAITSYNGYHDYDGVDHDKVDLLTYLLTCDCRVVEVAVLLLI